MKRFRVHKKMKSSVNLYKEEKRVETDTKYFK